VADLARESLMFPEGVVVTDLMLSSEEILNNANPGTEEVIIRTNEHVQGYQCTNNPITRSRFHCCVPKEWMICDIRKTGKKITKSEPLKYEYTEGVLGQAFRNGAGPTEVQVPHHTAWTDDDRHDMMVMSALHAKEIRARYSSLFNTNRQWHNKPKHLDVVLPFCAGKGAAVEMSTKTMQDSSHNPADLPYVYTSAARRENHIHANTYVFPFVAELTPNNEYNKEKEWQEWWAWRLEKTGNWQTFYESFTDLICDVHMRLGESLIVEVVRLKCGHENIRPTNWESAAAAHRCDFCLIEYGTKAVSDTCGTRGNEQSSCMPQMTGQSCEHKLLAKIEVYGHDTECVSLHGNIENEEIREWVAQGVINSRHHLRKMEIEMPIDCLQIPDNMGKTLLMKAGHGQSPWHRAAEEGLVNDAFGGALLIALQGDLVLDRGDFDWREPGYTQWLGQAGLISKADHRFHEFDLKSQLEHGTTIKLAKFFTSEFGLLCAYTRQYKMGRERMGVYTPALCASCGLALGVECNELFAIDTPKCSAGHVVTKREWEEKQALHVHDSGGYIETRSAISSGVLATRYGHGDIPEMNAPIKISRTSEFEAKNENETITIEPTLKNNIIYMKNDFGLKLGDEVYEKLEQPNAHRGRNTFLHGNSGRTHVDMIEAIVACGNRYKWRTEVIQMSQEILIELEKLTAENGTLISVADNKWTMTGFEWVNEAMINFVAGPYNENGQVEKLANGSIRVTIPLISGYTRELAVWRMLPCFLPNRTVIITNGYKRPTERLQTLTVLSCLINGLRGEVTLQNGEVAQCWRALNDNLSNDFTMRCCIAARENQLKLDIWAHCLECAGALYGTDEKFVELMCSVGPGYALKTGVYEWDSWKPSNHGYYGDNMDQYWQNELRKEWPQHGKMVHAAIEQGLTKPGKVVEYDPVVDEVDMQESVLSE